MTLQDDRVTEDETMALSAFDDKAKKPKAADLEKMLGRSFALWSGLIDHAASKYAPLDEAWNFAGANWGWSLRLKQKKRTILYLTPSAGFFYVGFVLGEKAAQAALQAGLPEGVARAIEDAARYAEGRGVRLEVRTNADLQAMEKLAAIKMAG